MGSGRNWKLRNRPSGSLLDLVPRLGDGQRGRGGLLQRDRRGAGPLLRRRLQVSLAVPPKLPRVQLKSSCLMANRSH